MEGDVPGCACLSGGHLLLITTAHSFLDARMSGPADLGGPRRAGWPQRPPDGVRRVVRVYSSFLSMALCLPPPARLARSSLPADDVIGPRSCCCLVLLPADPAALNPTRPSSARGRRPKRHHAPAPSGFLAPSLPQRPWPGTPDSPAVGPSSPPSSEPAGSQAKASSRPAVSVKPRLLILDGGVLCVYLAALAELQCPVSDYSVKYSGANWTSHVHAWPRESSAKPCRPGWALWRCSCSCADSACAPSQPFVHFSVVLGFSATRSVPGFATTQTPTAFCCRTFCAALVIFGHRVGGLFARVNQRTGCLHVRVYQWFVNVHGLNRCPCFAGTIPCRQPDASRDGHARHQSSLVPFAVARGVPLPAGVPVVSPVAASPQSLDPASPQQPPSSNRHDLVHYDYKPSSSSHGEAPASRGSPAASPIGDAAVLSTDDDATLSDDVAVSSPLPDAGSSLVVLPGVPVSPAASSSPPTSKDGAAVVPDKQDDVPEQPYSDAVTLQMPPDHTGLLEDQARLLGSLLGDPPSDVLWARCKEAWRQAVTLAVAAVRLAPWSPTLPA
ncbi:hypothetical protein MRX96_042228 [Rhipicephalus microplus]